MVGGEYKTGYARAVAERGGEVLRVVALYFSGGAIDYLTAEEAAVVVDLGVGCDFARDNVK